MRASSWAMHLLLRQADADRVLCLFEAAVVRVGARAELDDVELAADGDGRRGDGADRREREDGGADGRVGHARVGAAAGSPGAVTNPRSPARSTGTLAFACGSVERARTSLAPLGRVGLHGRERLVGRGLGREHDGGDPAALRVVEVGLVGVEVGAHLFDGDVGGGERARVRLLEELASRRTCRTSCSVTGSLS